MDASKSLSINAETRFAEFKNKKLAFRTFGSGTPIIFANRFRGDLDTWDPAFLDEVAKEHQVIIFEYSGTDSSTGPQADTHKDMVQDIIDIADYLGHKKFAVAGWSLGGFVAQIALTEHSDRVTHGILLATRIPGKNSRPIQKEFFERALKPVNDFDDAVIIFFMKKYSESIEAAQRSFERMSLRKKDLSKPMTQEQWLKMLQPQEFSQDTYGTFEKMKKTNTPILALLGEDDIVFPAEDWFDLKGQLPTVRMVMLPKTGHAPQHQYPELSGQYINNFLKHSI